MFSCPPHEISNVLQPPLTSPKIFFPPPTISTLPPTPAVIVNNSLTVGPLLLEDGCSWRIFRFSPTKSPPQKIVRIWVPPSVNWQNLGAPLRGLAESAYPYIFVHILSNNTHTCVLWSYLSYFNFFIFSFWQNLGIPL